VCFIFGAQSYGGLGIFYAWWGGFFCGTLRISCVPKLGLFSLNQTAKTELWREIKLLTKGFKI
jgi:hypothetical protein